MIEIKTKQEVYVIRNIEELERMILDNSILRGPIKKLSKDNLQDILDSNLVMAKTGSKGFDNMVKRTFNSGSQTKEQYWLNRGFDKSESSKIVSDIQKEKTSKIAPEIRIINAKKGSAAYKAKYKGNFSQFSRFHKDYWIKKGYDEVDASVLAKESNLRTGTREYLETLYTKEQIREIDKKKARLGSKNGMYGKVPAVGSGNGISGYYNGKYFRSSYEYFWMKHADANNIVYECLDDGVTSKMKILIGKDRTYTPDFYLVKERRLIEVRCSHRIEKILQMQESIRSFCKAHNMSYEVVRINEINELWEELFFDIELGIVTIDENKKEKVKKKTEQIHAESNSSKIFIEG